MTRRQVLSRLGRALAPVALPMALSAGARIVGQLIDVALVAGAAWSLAGFAAGEPAPVVPTLVVLAAMGIIKAVARYGEQYLGHYVAFGLLASMRTRFFEAIRPLAPAALADARSGDLIDRVMTDVDRVEVFYAHALAPAVSGVVVPMTVAGLVAWLADPVLGLWLLAFMFVAGVAIPALGVMVGAADAARAAQAGGELAAHLTDGIQGIGDVVIFGYGDSRLEEQARLARRAQAADLRAARVDGLRAGAFDAVAGLGLVVTGWYAVRLMAGAGLGLPEVAATTAAALMAFVPLRDLQQVEPAFDRALAAAARIFEITDRPALVSDPPEPVAAPAGDSLHFERVHFSYPGGADSVLAGVTLSVTAGSRVAIVGPSGSGKSTLAALAVRFWDPDRGRIAIDGHPLSALALADLRRLVTVVPQRPHLFAGTIADNLRLGAGEVTDIEMVAAARAAAVEEFVSELPDGYATQVGELGNRLSGGQRQRVALARGILRGTPILIVDEATSELDVDTEAHVLAGLAEATAERAVIIIAHRLATVTDADEIVVFDGGRVVESGTHDELMASGRLYARLWQRQLDTIA